MKQSSGKTRKRKNAGLQSTARSQAVSVLTEVLDKGRSLSRAKASIQTLPEQRDRSFAMELVNGVLRWRFKLDAVLAKLLNKPLRKKDHDLHCLLMIALYELMELGSPDYAVVNEAVSVTKQLGKQWASGMVNGVLRNFIREKEMLLTFNEDFEQFSHPQWLLDSLKQDWPHDWQRIVDANNQRPPMWLRVNTGKISMDAYASMLQQQGIQYTFHPHASSAVLLESPMHVHDLPGFDTGLVSVQDAAAQLAAQLLEPQSGDRVLDLCAAPGGKTCHLLEAVPGIDMIAVELEAERMHKVEQNLERLGLSAQLITGDATDAQSWWDGKPFDRILVDAPCSATGVIRRHPDIKSLRKHDDLDALTQIQQQILQQAWLMLKPGGELLYVTCSVLRQENEQQIEQLLSGNSDAREIPVNENWGVPCQTGRQLLPGEDQADGFYYSKLAKTG